MIRYSILALPAAAAIFAAAPAYAQTGLPGAPGDGAAGAPGNSTPSDLVGPALTPGSIAYNYANLIPNTVNNWLNIVPNSFANWSAILTGQPVPYPGSATPGDGTSFYGPTSLQRSQADASRLQTLANAGVSGYSGLG